MAPSRLVTAVLEQPIGITANNRETWLTNRRAWVNNLVAHRPDLDEETGEEFGAAMWTDSEFVASVSRDFVESCKTPIMVLPGVDLMHPTETGREIASLSPNNVVIEPWKDSPELVALATVEVREFLLERAARAT